MRLIRYLVVVFLFCPLFAYGQGSRKDDVATKNLVTGLAAAPGALITVCTSAGVGVPCTPLASIYSDVGLTSLATNGSAANAVSCSIGPTTNPCLADSNGNYGFYASPGRYVVTVTGAGTTGKSVVYTLACDPSAACTVSGTTTLAGLIQCKNFENILCVDENNTAGWAGADAGAWINAAYAALPASGGTIYLFGKAGGSCYSYSTPIVLNIANKYVTLQGMSATKPGVSGAAGGACLNYTPTTATTAMLLDYATTANGSAAHGMKDITLINNQCVTTAGCGSSAIGLDSGTVNKGTYEGHFDNVTIMGFNIGYRDLNSGSVDVFWTNPTITANLIGMQFNSPTGIFVMGGTIAGNSIAVQSSTTTAAPNLDFIGTQFFANVTTIFDFNPTTGLNMGEVNCVDCHLEDSQATNALFARGNINLTMMGGLAEEDNATGTTAQFFNTTGNKLWLQGVTFGCANTCTAIATVNSPTRAYISGHVSSVGHFTNIVNGANAAFATTLVSSGPSGTSPFLTTFEAPFKAGTFGVGDAAFVPDPTSFMHLRGNSATFNGLAIEDTGSTPRKFYQGPGTGGGNRYALRDATGARQMWESFFVTPFQLSLPNGVMDLAEVAMPGGNAGFHRLAADSATHTPSWNINNVGTSSPTGAWQCTNVTPVTVNANVATDQNLMACTIPAGTLNRVGRSLRIFLAGVYSTEAANASTVRIKVKLCTVSGCGSGTVITPISIVSGAQLGGQANDAFNVSCTLTVQTAGASAAFEAHGNLALDGITAATVDSVYADTNIATVGTIDSTAQLFLQITGTFSVAGAAAGNIFTERQQVLETVN